MSIKDNLSPALPQTLGGFSVLALEGLDAETFAQSQFMNDVRALEPMHWHWNGWLNAKGRVIALFAVLRVSPGLLWLILPDVDAVVLAAQLQRFVFRAKVRLRALDDVVVAGEWPGAQTTADRSDCAQGDAASGMALDWGSPDLPRRLLLLPAGNITAQPASADMDARWQAFDLAHGWPRLPVAQAESWTPQMLSLDRLAAFSIKKGCYPGQEIVARTHFLGQSKRGLLRIAGRALTSGEALTASGQTAGTVVCALPDGSEALAVAALTQTGIDSPAVTLLPLLDGLRRPR